MKFLLCPGAFKHSLTAAQTADAIARGLRRSGIQADFHLLPVADGGNGTLDAFLANGGERVGALRHARQVERVPACARRRRWRRRYCLGARCDRYHERTGHTYRRRRGSEPGMKWQGKNR